MRNTNPRYISNAPIGEDQFKGQSHKRISDILADEIREGSSRMVGLEGGWGSGKSNLIKLVDNKLKDTDNHDGKKYPVIIYDAWGHIADLQRRSILEEVTFSLINDHKVLGKSWVEKLDELLAKKKATRTKKMPALSTPLVTMLISTIFVPLVGYFMTLAPQGSIWKWMTPLLFIVCVALLICYERYRSMKRHEQKITPQTFFGEMLGCSVTCTQISSHF